LALTVHNTLLAQTVVKYMREPFRELMGIFPKENNIRHTSSIKETCDLLDFLDNFT